VIPLTAEDVAETLVWVASRPPHVNIDELLIKCTDQAAIHKVHRRTAKSWPPKNKVKRLCYPIALWLVVTLFAYDLFTRGSRSYRHRAQQLPIDPEFLPFHAAGNSLKRAGPERFSFHRCIVA